VPVTLLIPALPNALVIKSARHDYYNAIASITDKELELMAVAASMNKAFA
jgi:hypothetical protein